MTYQARELQARSHGHALKANNSVHGGSEAVGRRPYPALRAEVRDGHCEANNDTCKGFAQGGTKYCAGHARSEAKRIAEHQAMYAKAAADNAGREP
jgi:hypothetical protein